MYYYAIYGLKVVSDFELEAAHVIPAFHMPEADVFVHAGDLGRLTTETETEREKGSGFFYRYEKTRGWVRAVGNGVFLMQNGNEIIYHLKDAHDPLLAAEVILCFCLPVIVIQKERIILHGSGILWGGGAVVVSGQSGAGKSTLAEAMLRDGGVFMADDAVAVALEGGVPVAYPGFPQQKLAADAAAAYGLDTGNLIRLPDSSEKKYALRLRDGYCSEKKPLRALLVIQIQDTPKGSIKKVTGNEKFQFLTDNLYKYIAYSYMGFSGRQFRESAGIANLIEVLVLTRPPKGMSIQDELALVREALGPA